MGFWLLEVWEVWVWTCWGMGRVTWGVEGGWGEEKEGVRAWKEAGGIEQRERECFLGRKKEATGQVPRMQLEGISDVLCVCCRLIGKGVVVVKRSTGFFVRDEERNLNESVIKSSRYRCYIPGFFAIS